MITVGRTVLYKVSNSDALFLRSKSNSNYVNEGDVFPLIVVRVWENEFGDKPGINGQVMIDGQSGTYWVTSRPEGTEPGTWHWPSKV